MTVTISAIIATKGRANEVSAVLHSLSFQTMPVDEIIIVDQNQDDRIISMVSEFKELPIQILKQLDFAGVNASRNIGFAACSGDVVFFPDDDCWYPENFVETAIELLRKTGADIVSGRAVNSDLRSINGRFLDRSCWVDRRTAWHTQIEWVFVARGHVFKSLGGFRSEIGPGAGTKWGSCEIQDLSLRAIKAGFRQFYDVNLYGYHEESVIKLVPDGNSIEKAGHYARGFGYVLGLHRYGILCIVNWGMRPLAMSAFYYLLLKAQRGRFYFRVFKGRLLGYFDGLGRSQRVLPHDSV